jgi:L,D-transpeptidase catalytic domain
MVEARRLALLALAVLLATSCGGRAKGRVAKPKPPAAPVLERVADLAARVPRGNRIALRARPGGRILTRVQGKTEFGSPQTLAVAFRRGRWLAVRSPALGNGQVGWVDARAVNLRLLRRPLSLEVDLSRRELLIHGPKRVARRISVAIGAPETPTPPGEFYVTDKLDGAEFGPYYGCCILALSGRQPNLPRGWSGGDRLAIHGSPTATWGHAVSNGCLHADEADLRYLMALVPLGTAVTVHA